MKYINFKRNKFSTILKNINLSKLNLNRVYKHIYFRGYNFFKIYKYFDYRKYSFPKVYKYFDYRKYSFPKIYKYFDYRKYNFTNTFRNILLKFPKNTLIKIKKYTLIYALSFIILLFLIYSNIPAFYKYDKTNIENVICKGLNIECTIKGKVSYIFFPTPRIKVKELTIKDTANQNHVIGKIENTVIKVSYYNLLNKEKIKFKKTEFNNAEINLDLENFNQYKNLFAKKFDSRPINLRNGKIFFLEGKQDIASIKNIKLTYRTGKNANKMVLKGDFLGDKIYVKLKSKKKGNIINFFEIKLPGLKFISKGKIFYSSLGDGTTSGNILIKNEKNRISSIFDYKNNQINFKKSTTRGDFFDGKFDGQVNFLPYFNFNLNIELSSINFNRLHSALVALDKKKNKNLFRVNKKINGTLNLSSEKIFSKNTLINSFESQLQFINGNILFEKLLLNLKKLGAADLTGIIKNDDKFSNLKFESNIYVDNLKRFYNKFGIYEKEKIPSNLFVSGNLDLVNLILRLNEISAENKFNEEDISYIEKEFNEILLEERYVSFFNFDKLKEFIKLITPEHN